MSGHRSCADPPTGGHALRHATAVQGLPSQLNGQQQHLHHYQKNQENHHHRSAFLDKADSLLLARSKAATFSTPRTAGATQAAPPATFFTRTSRTSRTSPSSRIYEQPPPRRSRPSPAFAPRHLPAVSSSPTFVSVSPVIRQVSSQSESSVSSESSHDSSPHSHSHPHHSAASLLSPSPSSQPPFLPPRSRLRPQSTVDNNNSSQLLNNNTNNTNSNPLASFPPPAPPKPAHYSIHHYRRPPFSPPPPTSPPSYTSRLASFARAFSPPLPPLPLKTAADSSSFPPHQHNQNPSSAKMVSCGRVVCVALPFVLAVVSIVALLVAALAGVADKNLYMFEVNTTDLSVSPADAVSILSRAVLDDRDTVVLDTRAAPVARAAAPASVGFHDVAVARSNVGFHDASVARSSVGFHDTSLLTSGTSTASGSAATATVATGTSEKATTDSTSTNITAADLNLGKLYDIGLWNYCVTEQNGTRSCTKAEFNWAAKALNNSENSVTSLISSTGANLTIPTDITNAIKAFSTLAKWTQVVFLIAFGALALEIIFGLFTSCSRGVACVTFLIASITVVAVVGAAGLATAMSIVVAAAVKAEAEKYGVSASINGGFLAAVWISAAAAVAASFFWMFTVCCCSPESRRDRAGPRHLDDKSVPSGSSYQPLNDPNQNGGIYNNANAYAPQYGAPRYPQGGRSDLAYEPYSHSRV